MPKPSISTVWERIAAHSGERFTTKSGLPFAYAVKGAVLTTSRTEFGLSEADFDQALRLVPFDGPARINDLVCGPAYIWAILHDRRVRVGQW